jgi:hypothetical protein
MIYTHVIDTILDMHMTNISWDKEFRYVYRYTFNLFSFVVLYLVHRLSLYYIGYNVYRHFQPYFSYIVADSFMIFNYIINTNIVSTNPAHEEVYSIQHYVIQFVSDLWQVGGFLRIPRVSSANKKNVNERLKNKII